MVLTRAGVFACGMLQVFAGGHGGLGGRAGDERVLLRPGLGDEVPSRNPAAGEKQKLTRKSASGTLHTGVDAAGSFDLGG